MIYFPITSINNFFEDPDKVVNLSKKLKYSKYESEGSWPGVRSASLHTIDYSFFNQTLLSILSMYYEDLTQIAYSEACLQFHRIKPYSKSFNDIRNKGWIHRDNVSLGGIIYLNKNSFPESGTSLFTPKKNPIKNAIAVKTKLDFYKHGKINIKKYEKEQKLLEKKFIKTHVINNIYNNLIAFDGEQWHRCDNLYAHPTEERLSMVFFIGKIRTKSWPRSRLDKYQSIDITQISNIK
jgi:hypothetical protein